MAAQSLCSNVPLLHVRIKTVARFIETHAIDFENKFRAQDAHHPQSVCSVLSVQATFFCNVYHEFLTRRKRCPVAHKYRFSSLDLPLLHCLWLPWTTQVCSWILVLTVAQIISTPFDLDLQARKLQLQLGQKLRWLAVEVACWKVFVVEIVQWHR